MDRPISRILLLVDGSPPSESATGLTAALAAACRASVTAFSVVEPDSVRAELETALAAAVAVLMRSNPALEPAGGTAVETILAEGELVAEVVRKAEDRYDLTVLGARRRRYWEGERLSLRLWKLAKAIRTPVLLVPEGAPAKIRTVLFCTGGAHYIERGAVFAARLAAALGAGAVVLHVLPETPQIYRDWSAARPSTAQVLSGEGRLARRLRSQLHAFEKEGVAASVHLEEGPVEPGIFRAAREVGAELIVVGSAPSRGPFGTYVLGNVTREVAIRAQLPVLIVRSEPAGLIRDLWRILWEPAPPKRQTG
jgi:nucleotide-binding universal stress UspA family protein